MESLEDRADVRIGKSCNGCTTQLPRRQRSHNLVNTSNSSPSGPNVESLLQKKFCMELAKTFMIGSMSRPSHVRNAVAMLLTTGHRHVWSIDEVDQALRGRGIRADPSSIFRALARLERAGTLDRVEFTDGKVRYEVHQEHHEHIRCTRCDAIAPVAGCVLPEAQAAIASSTGYLVSGHQVLFEGLCPVCSKVEEH